jgi:hypothetical protein
MATPDSWLPLKVSTEIPYVTVYPSLSECKVGMVAGNIYCGPLHASLFGIGYDTIIKQPGLAHLIIDIFGGYIPPLTSVVGGN